MRRRLLVAVWLSGFSAACGHDPSTCEVAQDRLNECNAQIEAAARERGFLQLPLDLSTCRGTISNCLAACVAGSTCPAITYVLRGGFSGTDPNAVVPAGAAQFDGCVNGCVELASGAAGAPPE